MPTIAGLLHHLTSHAPGLSETNRQEYHDLIDRLGGDLEPAPEPEAPEAQEAPGPEAPEPEAPEE